MTSYASPEPVTGTDAGAVGASGAPVAPVALRLTGVVKRFPVRRTARELLRARVQRRSRVALDGVSLEVPAGVCFGVLGPNGAGKSTLFRLLATLVLPDDGRATVHGLDVVEDADAVRAIVGVVPAEDRSLFWRLSAAENVRLYATLHGLRGAVRSERVEWVLDAVRLSDQAGVQAGRLSTGMRQRLLLARALVGRPSVLLLDEPTRSLDPVAARDLRRFLREEIVGRQRCTVLLATHAAEEAFELCDGIAVLQRGRVVAEGAASVLAAAHTDGLLDLWTTAPHHPALDVPGVVLAGAPATEGDGWHRVRLRAGGGRAGTAALLERLVAAGVPVARVEPVRPTLADLLERLSSREGTGA
ncbi:MAG TPA: ABC transporter ATP-binding protein [Gemmatimonadales bacterium]